MPGFIKPQLATLKSKAPKGEQWLHEIKFDGYRIQVHINRGRKKVFTRNGLDWTKRFSVIAGALDIPGEAVTSQIKKQLDTVVSPKSKLTKPIKKPKATWDEPTFVADVEYRDITSEGLLRASSFKGLSRK